MPENPSGTTVGSSPSQRLTGPILIAGLLGGMLGGATSFMASRLIKPASQQPPPGVQVPAEARAIVEGFLTDLKTGKNDDFVAHAQMGMTFLTETEFKNFKTDFTNTRILYPGTLGPALGEFVLLRETALSPDLIQFTYLEKYERGGVIWFFVTYHGKDSWRLGRVSWTPELRQAFGSGL